MNLLKKGLCIKSALLIFKVRTCKSGFASPQIWICKNSEFANPYFKGFILCYRTKDLWRFVRIRWICENRPNLWKLTGFVINHSKQIFLIQDSWSTIGYKSRICFIRHGSNLFGVRICDHDNIQIHVFTNLLYNSCNLTKNLSKKIDFLLLQKKLYLHFSQEGREPRGWGRGSHYFFFGELISDNNHL